MAEVVNLRRFRKGRVRAEADRTAEINRAAFGRTLTERKTSEAQAERAVRRLDDHRLAGAGREDAAETPESDV